MEMHAWRRPDATDLTGPTQSARPHMMMSASGLEAGTIPGIFYRLCKNEDNMG